MSETLQEKISGGQRISGEEALELYRDADLYKLGEFASQIRFKKNPDPIVTYVIDRNINYTNICISGCKFCAYYCAPGQEGGYVLSFEELAKKIEETKALKGTQVLLQGGLHPAGTHRPATPAAVLHANTAKNSNQISRSSL